MKNVEEYRDKLVSDKLPPDPFTEIRVLALQSLRGINYWSRRPVTRMDLNIGAYENISSAAVPWFTDQLMAALPGLVEHQCSIGRRGGFIERLTRGTYAAHIVEHVALELQTAIGHDTGFGRTRGNGELAGYTVAFEHAHQLVGLRAAASALNIVQHAFIGTLDSAENALAELRMLAGTPDAPPLSSHVSCGITGGTARAETRAMLLELGVGAACDDHESLILELSPGYLLQAGLPYAASDIAIITDASLHDVPARYTDAERAARLVSMVADAVPRGGGVVCASDIPLVQQIVRDGGRVVHSFDMSDCATDSATDSATESATDSANSAAIRGARAAKCAANIIALVVSAAH